MFAKCFHKPHRFSIPRQVPLSTARPPLSTVMSSLIRHNDIFIVFITPATLLHIKNVLCAPTVYCNRNHALYLYRTVGTVVTREYSEYIESSVVSCLSIRFLINYLTYTAENSLPNPYMYDINSLGDRNMSHRCGLVRTSFFFSLY